MCQRCVEFDRDLKARMDEHSVDCENEKCIIPRREPCDSVFYHLMRAHFRMSDTMDRIKSTRKVVDSPDLVPSQLLRMWETHIAEAAECLASARKRREADEADSYLANLASASPKGRPS